MEQPQSANQKQREMFARLLQETRKREEAELESESDLNSRVEAEVLSKLAEEHGASQRITKLRKLRKEADDAEEALGKLGFRCDEGSISLKWDAPKNLREALDRAKRAARNERQAVLKKYDRAILGVWAAESVPEAKK